jgi:antitoxin HicB
MRYVYPFVLQPEEDGSAINVAFPDVPGARTFGADEAAAIAEAEDCLIAALGGYVELGKHIPAPSPIRGRRSVALRPLVAAKLALYEAMREEEVSNVALAERLGVSEGAVRRLLDLDHRSHIDRVEAALRVLGRRLEIDVRRAA